MSFDYEPDDLETTDAGISELLDAGYDQLDGYVTWSESSLGLDTRTAQQDCFNAESLMDYLANYHHKPIAGMNEYHLRWFVFSHYIRKSMADQETEERLLDSLRRFFSYLDREHEIQLTDWMTGVLEEADFFNRRRATFRALNEDDEREWKSMFREWCNELDDDLDSRCLLLPADLGDGMVWSDRMGWREATLRDEANVLWQEERSQLIEAGMGFEQIRDQLRLSYIDWVDTPQGRLDDHTPAEIIAAERLETPEDEPDEMDDEDAG